MDARITKLYKYNNLSATIKPTFRFDDKKREIYKVNVFNDTTLINEDTYKFLDRDKQIIFKSNNVENDLMNFLKKIEEKVLTNK